MTDSNTESGLHPAASVFRGVVLGDIGRENARLREDVGRLWPLLDHVQKVELIATINQEPIRLVPFQQNGVDGFMPAPAERKTISTVRLGEGKVEDYGGGEMLVLPIESSHELLLRNLGFAGGLAVRVAEETLVPWPQSLSDRGRPNLNLELGNSTVVDIDAGRLTIFITDDVSIQGDFYDLSDEDLINFKEEREDFPYVSNFLGYPVRDEGVIVPRGPTFKPTSIMMNLTPTLRKTLDMIDQANLQSDSLALEDVPPSDQLRSLTVAALGNDEHKHMLDENRRLTLHKDALMNIRDGLMRVDISHPDGTSTVSLQDGELRADEDGNHTWCIQLSEEDSQSMPVSRIKESTISLSGVELNVGDLMFNNMQMGRGMFVRSEQVPFLGLQLPYNYDVNVIGLFNWLDFDQDEYANLLNDFPQKIQASICKNMTASRPPFPDTFRLKPIEVEFSLGFVERTLKMVGLDEKLASIEDDAAPDE